MQLPLLNWRSTWQQPGAVRADLMAGVTGAVVVLPQGVAFATLAGLPPQYGLYAAMVPCFIAALFGSSRLMVTGPANAISLTTMALIAPLAAVGSPQYVSLVLTLTFLVGILQLILGWAKVGNLVDHVPHSVVIGFTAGAAVLIFNSQIGPLLGLNLVRSGSVWGTVTQVAEHFSQGQPLALCAGVATMFFAVMAKPWNRFVPAMLVAVVGGTLVAKALALWQPGLPALATVQPLPSVWPPLSSPDLSLGTVRSLFWATLVMTLLALTEASAIARAMARLRGDKLDGNQEFISQGLANVVGSFFSSYPASGSFNRSAVNAESGARTPLAAASAAVLLVLLLTVIGPLASHLPLAVIAGLLFVVATGLLNPTALKAQWQHEPQERITLVVTVIATITLSLEWAIVIGIATALVVRRFLGAGTPSGDGG